MNDMVSKIKTYTLHKEASKDPTKERHHTMPEKGLILSDCVPEFHAVQNEEGEYVLVCYGRFPHVVTTSRVKQVTKKGEVVIVETANSLYTLTPVNESSAETT